MTVNAQRRERLTELLTNYGPIPFLIIDCRNAPWGGPSYVELPFEEVDDLVKSIHEDCLLMNIGCTDGIRGRTSCFSKTVRDRRSGRNSAVPGSCVRS